VGQSTTALGLNSVLGGTGLSSVGLGGGHSSLLSTGLGTTGLNLTSTNPLSGGVTGLGGTSVLTSLGLGYSSSYSTYTNPLITSGAMKLKTLDDFDIGISRFNRGGTPCSPIPPGGWGLDSYGIDGVNPGFMHSQSRPLSRLGRLDGLDGELSQSFPTWTFFSLPFETFLSFWDIFCKVFTPFFRTWTKKTSNFATFFLSKNYKYEKRETINSTTSFFSPHKWLPTIFMLNFMQLHFSWALVK
jgi:hypothetical protein